MQKERDGTEMKTKTFLTVAAVGLLVFLGSAQFLWAGFLAGSKIGVIDIKKIMHESRAAGDARAMFLMDIESKKSVLKSKEQQILVMEKELKAQDAKNTAPPVIEAKQEEVAKAVKELRRLRDDMEEELKKKEQDLRRQLYREIKNIVQGFLKKQKLAIVMEKQATFAFDDAIDITDQIIELYDGQKR